MIAVTLLVMLICDDIYRSLGKVFSQLLKILQTAVTVVVGAGRSSEVERSLMVRWVVGSILHGVDPLSYFSFQPVLHDWCNKGRGMCYPVCSIMNE